MKLVRILFSIFLTIGGLSASAQSVIPLMSANVRYSVNDTDHSFFLSPTQVSNGFYESVELLSIDNTLVLRCEEGRVSEHGFVDEDATHSIMFRITGLTYEWIDPINQEDILFKGTCSSKQLSYELPFILRLNISGADVLSVGHNVKTLEEIKNYNLNQLFEFGKEIGKSGTNSSKPTFKNKTTKKHKPKLTK